MTPGRGAIEQKLNCCHAKLRYDCFDRSVNNVELGTKMQILQDFVI